MPNDYSHTRRQIDFTLARILKRVRALEAAVDAEQVSVRPQPRTRVPGPNTYKRMTTGNLAMAALAGVAMYSWGKREQDFFTHELDRRGLDESRNAWLNTDYEVPSDEPGLDTPRFDSFSDAQTVLTVGSLDTLAAAIDDVIVGDDGRVPGALPSVEVLEDLHLTGASPEAIEAFEEGTEISDISPSDLLETQPTKEPSLEYTPPEETLDNAPTL